MFSYTSEENEHELKQIWVLVFICFTSSIENGLEVVRESGATNG